MAQKVGAPGVEGSYRDKKAKQRAGKIAGKGRYTIDCNSDLSSVVPGINVLYSKVFAAGFFKSIGDGLVMNFSGRFVNSVINDLVFAAFYDENGNPIASIIQSPVVTTAGIAILFNGEGWLKVNKGKLLGGFGKCFTSDVAPNIKLLSAPGTVAFSKKIEVRISALHTNEVQLDYVTVEFSPGVIT